VLYNQFLSQADFEVLRDRAQVKKIAVFYLVYLISISCLSCSNEQSTDSKASVLQGLGVLVWQNPAHRVMMVTPHGHSEVKRFWKRQKSHT